MNKAVLVGNSNVGKTTLFNSLTNSDEHTGNWAGVTVGAVCRQVDFLPECVVVDLPGIYSLNCFSMEEEVSKNYLLQNSDDVIFNVVECKNLSRNLFLTLQMLEMGLSPKLLVNMVDETKKLGGWLNCGVLKNVLGIEVAQIDARKANECKAQVTQLFKQKGEFCTKQLPYLKQLPLEEIVAIAKENILKAKVNEIFAGLQVFAKNSEMIQLLGLDAKQISKINKLTADFGDTQNCLSTLRYQFIDSFINKVLFLPTKKIKKSEKLFFNKYFSILLFVCLLVFVFWLTFGGGGLGDFLVNKIDDWLSFVKMFVSTKMISADLPVWLTSFTTEVMLEGIGLVAKFFPQIVILYFFLNLLEDTGYISRIAFMFDGLLSKVGLSGKSIFTLLLSFGCNTTAIASSNNLGNKEVQKRTLLLVPFFPCSAKMPVFLTILMLAGPLLKGFEIVILVGLYIISLAVAAVIASTFKLFENQKMDNDFILEISSMRLPSLKRVLSSVWKNILSFFARLVGILFFCVAAAWLFKSFSFKFEFLIGSRIDESILAEVGKFFAFLFKPIGIFDWRICVALILGVTAKEVVAGTLVVLFGSGFVGMTWQMVIVVMLFVCLYVPCISTVAMIKKECGAKLALQSVLLNMGVAYGMCFVFYSFSMAFEKSAVLGFVLTGMIVTVALIACFVLKCKKNNCENCKRCKLHENTEMRH